MSKFREKAEAQTEEIIGQMLGDELLVKEGQERTRKAEMESGASDDQHAHLAQNKMRRDTVPRENDLENDMEGAWDQGGKHGGQKGMPRPEPRPDPHRAKGEDQGIVRDERGQERPRDKARAQQVSRVDKGGDPPGKKV